MGNIASQFDPTTRQGLVNIGTGGLTAIPGVQEAGAKFDDFLADPTGAEAAADAAKGAAQEQAGYQQQALDYLKQQEQLPSAFREAALTRLGQQQGFTLDEQGNVIQDASYDPISAARQNPLYNAILGTRDAGEQSILRNASATGGLRGGSTIGSLTDFNQQLEQNALLQAYNQNQNQQNQLLGLPSNANQIANQTAGIGQTLAQGNLASSQLQQQGRNQLLGLGLQGASLLI